MAKATARHILVDDYEACEQLRVRIEGGEDFGKLAAEFSKCPSGSSGGDLGEFEQGQMVPEFDQVVFHDEIGAVHGPVETQFGYHLIEITDRTE
ncbi:peptidylprolyl isomerase [Candidatus Bipolaricaulota bacterium]|nr:peptidylprolyl isomerase [Candidatus Bipolaricaulota bacterium]